MSNAIKFTEVGYVKIIAYEEDQYLKIAVADTGVGIKEEDKGKLFKLFGFLDETKKLNTKGIGLGLVIADQIVNQFEGKIKFWSE
jgi:signal transduction histidine kinase